MLIKINGSSLSPITDQLAKGIDIKYDFAHVWKDVHHALNGTDYSVSEALKDTYHVVHTPLNVDLSYAGHNIIKGDINSFNWAEAAIHHGVHGIGFVLKSLF